MLCEEIKNGRDSLYVVTANRYGSRTLTRDGNRSVFVTLDDATVCYYEGGATAHIRRHSTFAYENLYGNLVRRTESSTSQNITQGFLYAPFGEITTEYNSTFGNDIIPKYSFNAKELDEETGMYYYEARYYKPPVFTSRDPMMDQKPWLTPYHYCSNNPVGRVDPTGMFDTTNIKMNTHYKTILVLQSNNDEYDHNGAIAKDERIALKKGMPILYVDDIEDFAAAMEAFAEWGSSTDSYVISSHGSCNSFNIGSTDVDHSTDMTVLLKGLNNKTVFISACNVASCNIGKTLLQNFSKQTSSTVIGATEKIKGGYRYNGGMGLNWYGNVFYMSSKGSDAVEIYNLRIHQKKGMKYRTHLLSISIFRHENYDN